MKKKKYWKINLNFKSGKYKNLKYENHTKNASVKLNKKQK